MKITTLIIVISTLISCSKIKYNVSGRIYNDCGKQPLANTAIRIYQPDAGGGTLAECTTDAAGGFSFKYSPKNSAELHVGISNPTSGYSSFSKIPRGKDYSNISLYRTPTCTINFMLNVSNPYSKFDTLYVGNLNDLTPPYSEIAVPGPFVSGLIYTATNYRILNYIHDATSIFSGYRINKAVHNEPKLRILPCDTITEIYDIK